MCEAKSKVPGLKKNLKTFFKCISLEIINSSSSSCFLEVLWPFLSISCYAIHIV